MTLSRRHEPHWRCSNLAISVCSLKKLSCWTSFMYSYLQLEVARTVRDYQRQVPEDSNMLSIELCYPDTSRACVISKHSITYRSCFLVVPTRMQEMAQYRTCYSPASVESPIVTAVVFSPYISCKTAECFFDVTLYVVLLLVVHDNNCRVWWFLITFHMKTLLPVILGSRPDHRYARRVGR
jgi:hypothetical protein